MEKEAEFYELDVDTFKKFATKFQVEALPAFVVMHKFVKKHHVVGIDDLKKAIEDAHAKFGSEPKEPSQNSESVQPAQTPESIQPAKYSPEHALNYDSDHGFKW
ncbi:thioredoxin H5-like [Panicum miliaceum]|uniref:Thioredoxin H5-like n=1 Tax=Panicum miliaceum TaxID=4540 RepID=A0A3L6PJD0_PANMI|nr:thioredoxin H5-like [Panicum miliaceum]